MCFVETLLCLGCTFRKQVRMAFFVSPSRMLTYSSEWQEQVVVILELIRQSIGIWAIRTTIVNYADLHLCWTFATPMEEGFFIRKAERLK